MGNAHCGAEGLPLRGGRQIGKEGAWRNEVGSTNMSDSYAMGAAACRAKSGQPQFCVNLSNSQCREFNFVLLNY